MKRLSLSIFCFVAMSLCVVGQQNGIYETYKDYVNGNLTSATKFPLSFKDDDYVVRIVDDNFTLTKRKKIDVYGYQQRGNLHRSLGNLSCRLIATKPFPIYIMFHYVSAASFSVYGYSGGASGPADTYKFSKDLNSPMRYITVKELMKHVPEMAPDKEAALNLVEEVDKKISLWVTQNSYNKFSGFYLTQEDYQNNKLSYSDYDLIEYGNKQVKLVKKSLDHLTIGERVKQEAPDIIVDIKDIYGVKFDGNTGLYENNKLFFPVMSGKGYMVFLHTPEMGGLKFLSHGWDCKFELFGSLTSENPNQKKVSLDDFVFSKELGYDKKGIKDFFKTYQIRDKAYQYLKTKKGGEEIFFDRKLKIN